MNTTKPKEPCWKCRSEEYWFREGRMIFDTYSSGEWLCSSCHPNPNRNDPTSGQFDDQNQANVSGYKDNVTAEI